jgi:hypothetical protein
VDSQRVDNTRTSEPLRTKNSLHSRQPKGLLVFRRSHRTRNAAQMAATQLFSCAYSTLRGYAGCASRTQKIESRVSPAVVETVVHLERQTSQRGWVCSGGD